METIYSQADDCLELAGKLKYQLKEKITFLTSTYINTPCGKYLSSYRRNNGECMLDGKWLEFDYKFCKNEFLRIRISNNPCNPNNSFVEKMAALSDFYETLITEYGAPTVFYTIKDDEEEALIIDWFFKNQTEWIEACKKNEAFDDEEIDQLIIIGTNTDESLALKSTLLGLPAELVPLVEQNMPEYCKFKKGFEPQVLRTRCKLETYTK